MVPKCIVESGVLPFSSAATVEAVQAYVKASGVILGRISNKSRLFKKKAQVCNLQWNQSIGCSPLGTQTVSVLEGAVLRIPTISLCAKA